jgi:hypothetical protein
VAGAVVVVAAPGLGGDGDRSVRRLAEGLSARVGPSADPDLDAEVTLAEAAGLPPGVAGSTKAVVTRRRTDPGAGGCTK